jgi:MFS family permease
MFKCSFSQKEFIGSRSMPKGLITGKLQGVLTRHALISIFLLTNALVWYSYAIVVLQESISGLDLDFLPNILLWGVHFAALILSAIFGAFLTKRLGGRTQFLAIWIFVGIISSMAPLAVNTTEAWGDLILGVIFGFCFGFGMPNCMGFFTAQTPAENRGRIAGLTLLLTGVLMATIDSLGISGTMALTITLVVWRSISLLPLSWIKPSSEIEKTVKPPSYRGMLSQKPFILYFIPWIMFSLINYLTTPILQKALDPSTFSNLLLIQNVFIGASAFVGGVFIDKVGRKRLAIVGFVMLGLSFSLVGFFREPAIWYFHTIVTGSSWGILYVLYVLTIWGDLSHSAPSDKYYALGVSPFFVSKMLELTINAEIVATVDVTAIFTFAALFLFVAVLPLIYAPETLSEKIIRSNDLKNYIEKAKKEVAKRQAKEVEEADVEFKVNQEDEEKAEELAQKYY